MAILKKAIPLLLVFALGCSTTPEKIPEEKQEKPSTSAVGHTPVVLTIRTEPATIELNRDLQPIRPAEVFTEIESFGIPLTQVNLRFLDQGIEIPMQKVAGSPNLWKAEIDPKQLEVLAVSGQTVRYKPEVVAINAQGTEGRSQVPAQLAIRAPDLAVG